METNMAIKATKGESKSFDPVKAGPVAGRIYQVIELGRIPAYQGMIQHKVRVTFELPKYMQEFKEGEGEKPMSIGKAYTLSTHEKAALRGVIEAGIGTALTEQEAKSFDVETLIGKTMLVNIKHFKKDDGSEGAYIDSVSQLPDEMPIDDAINEPLVFSLTNFNEEKFNALPAWIQDKIKSSEEYQAKHAGEPNPDEIPF